MRAEGLLAQLLVQPCQSVWKELVDLRGDIFEVFVVVEGMPPAVDLRQESAAALVLYILIIISCNSFG